MLGYAAYLDGLTAQSGAMVDMVADWVRIPSGSHDIIGLAALAEKVKAAFSGLGASCEELELPPQVDIDAQGLPVSRPLGRALRFRKRPQAALRIFLGIHMDVVYGGPNASERESQTVTPEIRIENGIMHASGSADAKGGLVILLKALETLEASPFAVGLGWEVLINPDEELGSPGSRELFIEAAGRNHLGLLFEPALSNGNLVGARKGSGNFTAVVHGKAAHAGRDPDLGRNAIHALAHLIIELEEFGKSHPGVLVNVGKVEGGGALNRVPDMAIGRFNLRVESPTDQNGAESFLLDLKKKLALSHGIRVEITGGFASPPKQLGQEYLALLEKVRDNGLKLGLDLKWESSGGVSDGNKLAAAGLPNVDTMGAVGGNIHSPQEFLVLDSLVSRSKLTALLLMQLGSGDWAWPSGVPGKGI